MQGKVISRKLRLKVKMNKPLDKVDASWFEYHLQKHLHTVKQDKFNGMVDLLKLSGRAILQGF